MNDQTEDDIPSQLLSRPRTAEGTFLRILTINDVYSLDKYPYFAGAVKAAKAACALTANCVLASFLNGDFLSPSVLTALDQGRALLQGVNFARVDYLCLGNHEFDLGFDGLEARLKELNSNTTLLNSNVDDAFLSPFPRYSILPIGSDRTAVIGGFLTDQMDIYPPNAKPQIRPVETAMKDTWEQAKAALNDSIPDLFIPMTHQLMHQDRTTATWLSQHPELASRTPVLLGGHDHEIYIEEVGQSLIVKVGQEAEFIGVIDLWWTADGTLRTQIALVSHDEFPRDAQGHDYAQKTNAHVQHLLSTPLAVVPAPGSTKRVRFEESAIATWLLQVLKRGLNTANDNLAIDLALIQGGAIRGKADYNAQQWFTMGDLYNEFAFETPIGMVQVPGRVLRESVHSTRAADQPAPQFLHVDAEAQVSPGGELTHIRGKAIDRDRMYRIATWNHTLNGVNAIQPLYSYVQQHSECWIVPADEACCFAKDLVLEVFVLDAWRHLLLGLDPESCHCITQAQWEEAVDKTLSAIPRDSLDADALHEYMLDHSIHQGLALEMMNLVDVNQTGQLTRDMLLQQLPMPICEE